MVRFFQRHLKVSIYPALLIRLGVVLCLLMLSRLIFYWINTELFPGLDAKAWSRILYGGLRFDLAALFYVNSLYILTQIIPFKFRHNRHYQTISTFIFIFSNGLALLVNCIDFIYYKFTLRRSTLSVLDEFDQETGKSKFLFRFLIDYWYVVFIFLALMFLLIFAYRRIRITPPKPGVQPVFYYLLHTGAMLLTITLMVGGIRGDFRYSTRPMAMSNAGAYVEKPGDIALVLNTPFCIIRTSTKTFYKEDHFFTEDELQKIYDPVQMLKSDSSFKYDNVVIIILESFGKDGIGFYNHHLENGTYKGYTPFLDSLLAQSYVAMNSFANGRKSIDAIPSVLAGIPAGEIPFVLTPYAGNTLQSLPGILQKRGYQTSFFHGAPNGSMGFDAITHLLGVEKYFGKSEYNNDADFDGLWGIWDEPFFQFFAQTLDSIREPFLSTIFSVSSHHPFKVPEQYKGKFPEGKVPIYQCMGYTDWALRQFFHTASQMDWFHRTLFVITADHATVSGFPEYQTDIGNLSIPIVFYHPGDKSLVGRDSSVIQQTDILSSVLGYLNYNGPVFSYGKNIFDSSRSNFAAAFMRGNFHWIEDEYLLNFSEKKVTGLYNYAQDKLLQENLTEKNVLQMEAFEKKAKAFIQQYHNRLIRDEMVPVTDSL